MLIEGDSPVIERLNSIHEIGTACIRAGTVGSFRDFGESLRNRFNVSFRYNQESEQLISQRVLYEIMDGRRDLGISFFVAGYSSPIGYPIHTTALEGLYGNKERTLKKEDIFDILSKIGLRTFPTVPYDGGFLDTDSFVLKRVFKEFKFDSLLVGDGCILLAATEIPREITDLREELSTLYSQFGLETLPLDNLFHITLTRMTTVVKPSMADIFIERIESLHQKVAENPLILKATGLQKTSAFDMLHSR